MKILIIGCEGYIGSSLRAFLKKCNPNIQVMGVDVTLNNDYCNLNQEDIKDYDCIILLAGHSSVNKCVTNPVDSLVNNVIKFINFTKLLNPRQKFIYASSSSVYGNTYNCIADESYIQKNPHNEYDFAKQVIDKYMEITNLNYYGLRLGTVNGYSPKTRYDLVVNAMVKDAKTKGVISIYNGKINRPILDIQDLNRAIYTIINSQNSKPGIYNISSFNSSIYSIGKTVSQIMNVPFVQKYDDKQQTTYNFAISNEKFCDTFGFKFEGTIENIINSFKV